MIVYHGTTRHAARQIARDGFQPRSPSRRVWLSRKQELRQAAGTRQIAAHAGSPHRAGRRCGLENLASALRQ